MRIREIEAENFKLFTKNFHEVNEIEKSDLIVFNGPNGYGKTSAFDIIEFCLTGTIKRIGKYNEELAVKKTEAFDNKILISDETKEAFVKILFDNDGKCIEIKYTYFPAKNKKRGASKENNPHNIFGCFNREIICDGEKIYNQEKFLSEIQFDDIEEIFDKCCFLSQDEHLQFLKAAKKSKAEGLNFLLDVPTEWEKEQEKVNKKIDLLSNKKSKNTSYIPRLKSRQEKEKQKLTELKEKMLESQEDTSITYRRLYTNKNVSWDNENFRIDEITYKNSIKEIDDLIYFSEHKQECGDYHWNLPYQDYIKEYNGDKNISFEEYPLEYAYRFINLLKREKDIEEKYEKEKLLYISNTDELTRCFNRHAYEERINNLDLREEWIYISMDLNNLKHTNDSLGHAAGDELICAAADCMRENFGKYGNVYRIGGDEFVVIITGNTKEFQSIIESFDRRVAQWHGKLVDSMTISWGYVFSSEKEWDNIYDIAKEADERMYKNKERYYQESKIVRRR